MITLKEFVKETLSQIVEGINEFEECHRNDGITAKPNVSTQGKLAGDNFAKAGMIYLGHLEGYASIIDFDVAITTEESENAQAGGGIKVFSALRADGSIGSQTASATVSRINFKLPLKIK